MKKKTFTPIERYAIWKWHEERCWFCLEPLSYRETTIDHVFPESLLHDDHKRASILNLYNLSDNNFKINGFENWLPCHARCNQQKSVNVPSFMPAIAFILARLIQIAPQIKNTVDRLLRTKKTDKVFLSLLQELETGVITFDDLLDFVRPLGEKENIQFIPGDLIILSGGYWVYRNSIAREGLCTCERNHCVESDEKVYCYFSTVLAPWVIQTGLYHKCYDELIDCPRCEKTHKRGHVGKAEICGRPYLNQELQTDNQ